MSAAAIAAALALQIAATGSLWRVATAFGLLLLLLAIVTRTP